MQATLLDEEELEFVGQDLANAHVDTLDEALAVIRTNVAALNPPPSRAVGMTRGDEYHRSQKA